MTSAEDVFRPAFEEISRRQTATLAGNTEFAETTYFARDGEATQPYVLPGQNFVLVTMGTNVLAPRPLDPTRPALRVYGAFDTKEEAREHAVVIASLDATCSLAVVPAREWFLLPQNEACRDDPEVRARRTAARLDLWRARKAEEHDEFERRVRERDGAPPEAAATDEATATITEREDGTTEAEELVYRAPRRLRTGGEVRGQGYAALSVIPDDVVGECLVNVHGLFESASEADRWSRNVATRHVTDTDVVTAPACEWVYPNGTTDGTTTHYRNDELQRIMDAAERNPRAVQDYKEWMAQQDTAASATADASEGEEKNGGGE